jgi:hypothetical protein
MLGEVQADVRTILNRQTEIRKDVEDLMSFRSRIKGALAAVTAAVGGLFGLSEWFDDGS